MMSAIRDLPRQFLFIGGIIVAVFLWVVISLAGFWFGNWDNETIRILLQAGGVVATVLLIGVYLVMAIREYQTSEDERIRWLYTDVIAFVIDPARERLMENKNRLDGRRFSWSESDPVRRLKTVSRDLGTTEVEINRFSDRFPDLYRKLEEHDHEHRITLAKEGLRIRGELREPIRDYLADYTRVANDDLEEGTKELIRIILNGRILPQGVGKRRYNEIWHEHQDNLIEMAEEIEEVDLAEFDDLVQEYIDLCKRLYTELNEARDELRQEHAIPTHHIQDLKDEQEMSGW